MAADEERKTGKAGTESGSAATGNTPPGPAEREVREPRDTRLPLSEILRRGLSAGRDVSESLFPRELANTIASQLIDARHGLVNAIAVEVGRFLRQADIASEMRKVLAGLSVEAKISLRFSEDERGKIQTQVDIERERNTPRKTPKPQPPEG